MLTQSEEDLCEQFNALSLRKPLVALDAVQCTLPVRLRYLYLLELRLPREYTVMCSHGGDDRLHRTAMLKVGLTSEDDGPLLTQLLCDYEYVPVKYYLAHADLSIPSSTGRLYAINQGLEKLFGRDKFELRVRLFVPLPRIEGRKKLESTFRKTWGVAMPRDWPAFFLDMARYRALYETVCGKIGPTEWILVDRYFVDLLANELTSCRRLMRYGLDLRSDFCTVPGPVRFRLEYDHVVQVRW